MDNERSVGLIGVGTVGKSLVDSLREADYPLVVHDVDDDQVEYATSRGAEAASSPEDIARAADVIILALPGSPEVEAVFEGDNGIGSVLDEHHVVIDTSTVRIRTAEACATTCRDRGARFVSAPLTQSAPVDGLFFMVGGPHADYHAAVDILDVVGADHVRFDDVERALRFKFLNQVRYASHYAVDAETVTVAEECGIDPSLLNTALGMGIDNRLFEEDFEPGMEGLGGLEIWKKDLGYAIEATGADNEALPIGALVHEVYKAGHRLANKGEGHKAAIKRYWQALNDR